jgi:ABC-2 type transport system ATP-binding protein
MHAPIIDVTGLSKSFNGVRAVEDVSFSVRPGEVIGLLGTNGAGKTTTLAMLLGLLLPSAGSLRVLGEDVTRHRERILNRINFSSPYLDLPRRLTVRQNLTVFAHLYGVAGHRRRIEELAEDLELTDLLDRRSGHLSAGQKTRISLAKALINRPELLLLDEPTASLDPDAGDWIRGYLETYRSASGAAIVLASHNMGEVERLCDRILIMRAGRIAAEGPTDLLLRRYGRERLEEVFLDVARERAGAVSPSPRQVAP